MKNIFIFATVAFMVLSQQCLARDGFAIVVDAKSYDEAKTEIAAYASAIEQVNGLKVYTVIDKWGVPDSIRAALIKLNSQKKEPVIGCILVGDIPIAMIRDGQHMTSAFKMNQSNDRKESSVPSDRFYDDFGLSFIPQGKDEKLPYFYYSVAPQSEQRVHPTLYSGRIRPTDAGGTSRYDKLRAFLQKATVAKKNPRGLNKMFYFSGHGYISESKVARIDEKAAYFEHFPWLKNNRNVISYIDHSDQNPVKERLMNELMRSDLDLAVLHHHGYWDTEYFNGLGQVRTVREAKEFIIQNIREHVYAAKQKGKNYDSLAVALANRFDVPMSWLKGADSDSLAVLDSIEGAAADLHLEDFALYGYRPNAPVVVIDACFCGSFHKENCIANEYIFQPGGTVAVVANTVNTLQDRWSDHLIGLMAQGGVVADLVRFSSYLESHLIGDPTYSFVPANERVDVDHLISANDIAAWKKLLKNPQPDLQSLAILKLAAQKAISSDELLGIVKSSPYGIVRLQALECLGSYKGDNFVEAVKIASQDSYELLQRRAIRYIAASGDERLIPALISLSIANNTSDRCNFNALNALSCYPVEKLQSEFARQFDDPAIQYIRKDSVKTVISRAINIAASRLAPEIDSLVSNNMTRKEAKFMLRSLRNTMVHYKVPELVRYFYQEQDEELRITLLEALGWHANSFQLSTMSDFCKKVSADTAFSQAIRDEALKTYNRLNAK